MAISKITNPEKSYTIEQFITFKDDDTASYNNLSFRDKYDNIIYPIKNIIDDYTDELNELLVDVVMSESEFLRYRYRPKLLAFDIYSNAELDFLILAMNGVCNMKEFDSRSIKLIKNKDLDNFITSIFNANKDDLDIYNSAIYETTS